MHSTQYSTLTFLLALSITNAADQAPDQQEADQKQHQRIEILKDSLPTMGTNQTPIKPTEPGKSTPHQTGITQGQDWMRVVNNTLGSVQDPSRLAEGSFILSRTGRLVPAPNDRIIFVPAPEQRLRGEGPILLLPCNPLERLESIWINQPVTLSGEILSYHRRNHLLISDFTLGLVPSAEIAPPRADHPGPTGTGEPTSKPSLNEDPDVLDLLRELDSQSDPNQISFGAADPLDARLSPQTQPSAPLQTAPPELAPGLREGTLMIRRPARLDRASDGSWMVIFDNDEPSSPHGIELTILPCSLLMAMETQAIAFGDAARFVVSGRVYIHNQRGYLLPTFYQRLRTSDIKPWQ